MDHPTHVLVSLLAGHGSPYLSFAHVGNGWQTGQPEHSS